MIDEKIENERMKIVVMVGEIEDSINSIKEYLEDLKIHVLSKQIDQLTPKYPAQIEWRKTDEIMPEDGDEVLIVHHGIVEHVFFGVTWDKERVPHFYQVHTGYKSWELNKIWYPKVISHWAYLPKPPEVKE